MKKQKINKKVPYLDYLCTVGERVQWETIKGEKFEGKLVAIDENCLATIQLDDDTEMTVQC